VRLVQGRVEAPAEGLPLSPYASVVTAAGTDYSV